MYGFLAYLGRSIGSPPIVPKVHKYNEQHEKFYPIHTRRLAVSEHVDREELKSVLNLLGPCNVQVFQDKRIFYRYARNGQWARDSLEELLPRSSFVSAGVDPYGVVRISLRQDSLDYLAVLTPAKPLKPAPETK